MTEQELLVKLKAFNPDFSQLQKCLNKRNFFRILGLGKLETRHSNMLAWLLDSNENHNLDDSFVVPFLQSIIKDNKSEIQCKIGKTIDVDELMKDGLRDFSVEREHYFIDSSGKMRYIDLLLVSRNSQYPLVICIENKVMSLQHDGQLEAYQDYILNLSEYKGYCKLFLYLTPTKEIIDGCLWTKISYHYVTNTLDQLLTLDNIEDEVKLFITHYRDIIRRDIMNEDLEIRELCRNYFKGNKEIYQTIFKNTLGAEKEKLTGAIVDKLDELVTAQKIKLIVSSNQQTNTEFKFVTNSLIDVMPLEESQSSCRVWKAKSRIVYVIQVAYKEGIPDKIYFYSVLVTGNNDIDKPYTETILNTCKRNKGDFNVTDKQLDRTIHKMDAKLVTKIYAEKDYLKVPEEINDEFIKKLNAEIDSFIANLQNKMEEALKPNIQKIQ